MQCNNYNQHTGLVMRCDKEKGHAGLHEADYEIEIEGTIIQRRTCWMDAAGKETDAREVREKLESLRGSRRGRKVKGYRREDRQLAEEETEEDEEETDDEGIGNDDEDGQDA